MSGFSTCRSATAFPRRLILAAVLASIAAVGPRLEAAGSGRSLSQYIRDRWALENGFPGGSVYAITQSSDGYLWIGAEKGLVRFDGLGFRLLDPGSDVGVGRAVLGVAAAADGSVWARPRGLALFRLHRGRFHDLLPGVGPPDSVVSAMIRARDDTMLLATVGRGAVAYRQGQFTPLLSTTAFPVTSFVVSIAEGNEGDVWLGTRDGGLLRVQGDRVTRFTQGLPDSKINCLLAGDGGELWIGTDRGVARWDGVAIRAAGVPSGLRGVAALSMIRDRESRVWIAAGSRGLVRVSRDGAVESSPASSFGHVAAVFEDRDGNVWVGTDRGLERWREPVFTAHSVAHGMPAESIGAIHADEAGRVWFGPSTGGLFWIENGRITEAKHAGVGRDIVYSIHGRDGELWVARQRGGVTRLQVNGAEPRATHFTHRKGLARESVFAVHRARNGTVWAGTLTRGASRFQDGRFVTYDTSSGLPSNTIASILEARDGTVWFATPNGVAAFWQDRWRTYATSDGLPSNEVNGLFEDRSGVLWVGTARGIAVIEAGQLRPIRNLPAQLRGLILGFAEDHGGSLWVNAGDRVVRIARDGLLRSALEDGDLREYGVADGLLAVESMKRPGTVAADSEGRIWFALTRGLAVADPNRAEWRSPPALAVIEEVTADGAEIDVHGPIRIPAHRRRIAFTYNGLSLSLPERVRFRYRLDGFDQAWSEPGAERHAVYTNLAPGSYRFRVIASNSEGLWTGAEAALPLDIRPMFWQTAWFQLAAFVLAGVSGWGAYRLRVRQVARRLSARFEERLAERTRIAQELHDTLLQGFVSASMQLHVAVERLPEDSSARSSLRHVLDLMAKVTEEGRNAVRGLRSVSSTPDDLAQAFAAIQKEVAATDLTYRIIVEGRPRALKPIVRDEVYRIGRESLLNAFRHSGGTRIEIELEYRPNELCVLVRDDGRGLSAEVGTVGSDGHWGIPGMRERAQRVGAGLKIRSRPGAGTEVELRVPARVAFERQVSPAQGTWRRWFRARAAGASAAKRTENRP